MRIKMVELINFKRFTHLLVENIPQTAKMVVLVGPNGSGKTSFLEAMNHYYKFSGYQDIGDSDYLWKKGFTDNLKNENWLQEASRIVNIDFYDVTFPKTIGRSPIKGHFYFRSAYRNEPDFHIDSMKRQENPTNFVRLPTLIQDDRTVSSNYQRLIVNTIAGVFDNENNKKTVENLRNELIGKIQIAIENVFEDLHFSSIGEPLNNGNFYFTKGSVQNFHYRNLSAGEKSAFDLILDMVVKSRYYPDAIYCIDEPEIHMHTKLQGRVLRELYQLVPEDSQLWISTHSIGMLQEAEDIEKEHSGTVVFLDFGGKDFDDEQIIRPAKIGRAVLDKFYELAFGDFAKLMLPKCIVFCEGNPNGNTRKDFDKTIYTTIFGDTHSETLFISGGSCSELENLENNLGEVMKVLLSKTKIIKLVDRDDRTDSEVEDLLKKNIKVLSKRHLESYLLDDSIIKKLCIKNNMEDKIEECLSKKQDAIQRLRSQGKPLDDIKSARGEIYNSLKRILNLIRTGSNADYFIRDTMAPLVTPDTEIYKMLERDIFENSEQ